MSRARRRASRGNADRRASKARAPLRGDAALSAWLRTDRGSFLLVLVLCHESARQIAADARLAAMQSINVVVINRWFMSVFFGTAIMCLVLAILSVFRWQTPGVGYRLIGSLLYLLGTILVTIVCNVPLNDSLAAVDPTSTNAGQVWANYATTWTAWNHVRTIARWQLRLRLLLRAVAPRRQQRRNKCPKTVRSFVALLRSERKIRRAIC
jgi:uncharacterized membrane protein